MLVIWATVLSHLRGVVMGFLTLRRGNISLHKPKQRFLSPFRSHDVWNSAAHTLVNQIIIGVCCQSRRRQEKEEWLFSRLLRRVVL